jgi:hypothetical protein
MENILRLSNLKTIIVGEIDENKGHEEKTRVEHRKKIMKEEKTENLSTKRG